MSNNHKVKKVPKPILRSRLRQIIGKEYFIFKRKLHWYITNVKWSSSKNNSDIDYSVFKHRSMVLRPLRNVDMILQENKRRNLEIAISHLDKLVIEPGETFSLWKLVGRPTKRKGYLEGLVLSQGKISSGTGGGLCQLGNLLFWVFAHSPLRVVERYRHGYDVFPDVKRKVPFGAGATLAYNYIDLQVKNETNNRFQINLWLDDTHLNGELLSQFKVQETYKVEERDYLIQQEYWGGYTRHNRIIKIVSKDGSDSEELLAENHAIMMYSPLLND